MSANSLRKGLVIVQLVLVKETNVATKSKKAKTTIMGIYKKRKTADENLLKYAKENAVDTQCGVS